MPKIEEMYAYIAEEGPEDEGVVAMKMGDTWMPMVGADMARMESLKPIALVIGLETGQEVKLVKFTNRIELEVIG